MKRAFCLFYSSKASFLTGCFKHRVHGTQYNYDNMIVQNIFTNKISTKIGNFHFFVITTPLPLPLTYILSSIFFWKQSIKIFLNCFSRYENKEKNKDKHSFLASKFFSQILINNILTLVASGIHLTYMLLQKLD